MNQPGNGKTVSLTEVGDVRHEDIERLSFATGSFDHTIRLWETGKVAGQRGGEKRQFANLSYRTFDKLGENQIMSVAFTADSRRLLYTHGFGSGALVISFYLLAGFVNMLAALLSLAGMVYYVILYSLFLKNRNEQNIVIGGGAGAIPPLVGWAAATGTLDITAGFLFLIVFWFFRIIGYGIPLFLKLLDSCIQLGDGCTYAWKFDHICFRGFHKVTQICEVI